MWQAYICFDTRRYSDLRSRIYRFVNRLVSEDEFGHAFVLTQEEGGVYRTYGYTYTGYEVREVDSSILQCKEVFFIPLTLSPREVRNEYFNISGRVSTRAMLVSLLPESPLKSSLIRWLYPRGHITCLCLIAALLPWVPMESAYQPVDKFVAFLRQTYTLRSLYEAYRRK